MDSKGTHREFFKSSKSVETAGLRRAPKKYLSGTHLPRPGTGLGAAWLKAGTVRLSGYFPRVQSGSKRTPPPPRDSPAVIWATVSKDLLGGWSRTGNQGNRRAELRAQAPRGSPQPITYRLFPAHCCCADPAALR